MTKGYFDLKEKLRTELNHFKTRKSRTVLEQEKRDDQDIKGEYPNSIKYVYPISGVLYFSENVLVEISKVT